MKDLTLPPPHGVGFTGVNFVISKDNELRDFLDLEAIKNEEYVNIQKELILD